MYVKELDSAGLESVGPHPSEGEEVGEELFALLSGDGFGVELDPIKWMGSMAERHDLLPGSTVGGPGGHLELAG